LVIYPNEGVSNFPKEFVMYSKVGLLAKFVGAEGVSNFPKELVIYSKVGLLAKSVGAEGNDAWMCCGVPGGRSTVSSYDVWSSTA
jgi:hypothetical protein